LFSEDLENENVLPLTGYTFKSESKILVN